MAVTDINIIVFLSGFIPGLVSFLIAVLSTKDLVSTNFIEPTVRHVSSLHRGYLTTKIDCDTCNSTYIDYIKMSLSRLQLSSSLIFASVSLLTLSLGFFANGKVLPGFSFFVYFLVPLIFCSYNVLAKREIFHWWESPIWKPAFMLTLLSISAFAAISPELLSVFDIFFNNTITQITLNIGAGITFPILHLQIGLILILIIFGVWRVIDHFYYSSLRSLLRTLFEKSPKGFTIVELTEKVNQEAKRHHPVWDIEAVFDQIKKLIYQGLVIPTKPRANTSLKVRFLGPNTVYKKCS